MPFPGVEMLCSLYARVTALLASYRRPPSFL